MVLEVELSLLRAGMGSTLGGCTPHRSLLRVFWEFVLILAALQNSSVCAVASLDRVAPRPWWQWRAFCDSIEYGGETGRCCADHPPNSFQLGLASLE